MGEEVYMLDLKHMHIRQQIAERMRILLWG
jgi:hypothetical protein